ncbi:MAG: GntR family transcriptional regulator [Croceitalea sp.]|nr:GntR family transcriptional regulator [Croceitalea sp.]
MIELGNYNTLRVARTTSVGIFLEDDQGTDILLPNKYVPEGVQLDQILNVFCYLDNMERPVATTLKPTIIRNRFAFLEVVEVNEVGAFVNWGIAKNLLVPFREQRLKMVAGQKYLIYCYMDEKSFRLVGSNKIDKFLSNEDHGLNINDEVDLIVSRKTDLGWEVIINNKCKGLVFFDDVFKSIQIGDTLKGYIKKIREDLKIDVALQPLGIKMLDPMADFLLKRLQENDGYLPLHDKSAPEEIKAQLEMSKKTFKKAVGVLYKGRKLEIREDGIYLKDS